MADDRSPPRNPSAFGIMMSLIFPNGPGYPHPAGYTRSPAARL